MTRRRFFARAAAILSVPLAVTFGWPLIASILGPMYKKTKAVFSKVKGFRKAPIEKPVELPLPYVKTDAFMRQDVVENVWVLKKSDEKATVYSPICPHLGCRYNWNEKLNKFICPCHGSIFSKPGKVLAGPAPRPLDQLPHKIEKDGTLEVKWERFEPGIPNQKII